MVVDVDVVVRTSADSGVKPHPRAGTRKAALSATGMSSGAFDFEDCDDADPALTSAN
jgi:hypothetical protein